MDVKKVAKCSLTFVSNTLKIPSRVSVFNLDCNPSTVKLLMFLTYQFVDCCVGAM